MTGWTISGLPAASRSPSRQSSQTRAGRLARAIRAAALRAPSTMRACVRDWPESSRRGAASLKLLSSTTARASLAAAWACAPSAATRVALSGSRGLKTSFPSSAPLRATTRKLASTVTARALRLRAAATVAVSLSATLTTAKTTWRMPKLLPFGDTLTARAAFCPPLRHTSTSSARTRRSSCRKRKTT